MFTRVVELTTSPGKVKELSNTLQDKILPILKQQTGFVDETVLVSDTEPDRILALSYWKTKEDAQRYQREQYPNVHQTVQRLLATEPVIRTFDVHLSTNHKIAAGKAA